MELALIAPVMVVLVFGVLDLSRAYRMQIRLENAAREGGVYAQLHPNRVYCDGTNDIVGRVLAEDDGLASMPAVTKVYAEDATGAMQPVTGCADAEFAGGRRQQVQVTAQFDVLTPVVERITGDTIQITGAADIEVQE